MPCRSLFRKALPGKPVASADAHTARVIAQPTEPHAVSVVGQITGLSNVGAPGGGTVQPVAHHPREGHRIDRRSSGNKPPNKGKGRERGGNVKQRSTPKRPGSGRGRGGGKPFKTNALTVTGLSGSQHPPKVDGPEGDETKESVSMNADLSRPAHPPKVSGEQFHNTFACDALISNGNELYDPPSNKGKAYTDTDSDGKTEIITDITCKFKGKLIAMEVKVDPGSETNCIPLSHFRRLFPQLCSKDGSPKENALEPTLA